MWHVSRIRENNSFEMFPQKNQRKKKLNAMFFKIVKTEDHIKICSCSYGVWKGWKTF